MENEKYIQQRVTNYYRIDNVNCTTASLRILAEIYSLELSPQILDSAIGMHGAGKYGAQCGLVEGGLLFIGILGRARTIPDELVVEACHRFAEHFEQRFSSLLCRELRPQGFAADLPPHLCMGLTCEAIGFSTAFVREMIEQAAAD